MTSLRKKSKNDIFLPQEIDQLSSQLNNFIATRSHTMSTQLVDEEVTLNVRLSPMAEHTKAAIVLHLKIWGEETNLILSGWPQANKLQAFISEDALLELPEDLAVITLATAFESIINTASQALSTKIEIIRFSVRDEAINDAESETVSSILSHQQKLRLFFNFNIENEPEIEASLALNKKILSHLASSIRAIPAVPYLSAKNLDTPIYLEYGRSCIPQDILSSAEAGDILMIDSPINTHKGLIRLRFISNQTFIAQQADSLSYHLLEEDIMENNTLEKNIPLSEIPLNITFDLGKESIKLEEMEKIGVGYTLDLERELSELVTIRIEDKAIGHGELVNIGDRVGVRITQLNAQPKRNS